MKPPSEAPVPLGQYTAPLSELIIVLENWDLRDLILRLNHRLEHLMADLNQSVADLQAAVDAIASRIDTTALQQALADAKAALDAMTVQDEADKQALADSLAAASSAADSIEGDVTQLNSLGNPPA